MYIRDKRIVEVLTYTNERDSYGQKRQSEPASREVEMDIKIFSQVNVSDPSQMRTRLNSTIEFMM